MIVWVVRLASVPVLAFALVASVHALLQGAYASPRGAGWESFACRSGKAGNVALVLLAMTLALCFLCRRFLLGEDTKRAFGRGLVEYAILLVAAYFLIVVMGADAVGKGAIERYTVRACGLGDNWR